MLTEIDGAGSRSLLQAELVGQDTSEFEFEGGKTWYLADLDLHID